MFLVHLVIIEFMMYHQHIILGLKTCTFSNKELVGALETLSAFSGQVKASEYKMYIQYISLYEYESQMWG